MADGFIDVDVKLNGSPAEAQAAALGKQLGAQVQKGVDEAGTGAKKSTQQALNDIGGSLTTFGSKYTKAVTLPIAAAAVATGVSAVKIDTALTGVRKTVDGTEQQYEQLKQSAIEFSKTNAVDPAQILDIQALGAQLGYSITELDKFGEVVSGLSISTNMDAETAAMELASFSNIMKMSHDDVDKYGSTIVDLGNHFATTESDISHMAQRIAGAGKQLGMSEADVLGMATALSSMGINAEAGGTAISTLMSNIDKDVATGSENLKIWADTAGMSVDQFKEAWGKDVVGTLGEVFKGMEKTTEEGGNLSVLLDELGIGAIRQTDMIKRLANNTEMLPKAISTANNAWEENVALTKEVENRNNSMAAQLQILWNKVQAVAIEVGEPLMKALIGILDAADPLIDALASGAQAFADLDEDGQRVILMAVGIVAAIGPVTGIFGKMITGIQNSTNAWRKFSDNLKVVRTNLANSAKEVTKGISAQSKYKQILIGGQQATVKYDAATKKLTVVQSKNVTMTKAQAIAMKASTVATKAQTVAMKAGAVATQLATKAMGLFKTALKTIAPVAILTTVVTVFTKIADATSKARKAQEDYNAATKGLEEAAAGVTSAVQEEAEAFDDLSESTKESAFDDLIERHKQLADTITETKQSVSANQGMLDDYADTIRRLDGTVIDNEEDLAAFKLAVEGINESMGTNYQVVQGADGAYRIMADGVEVVKEKILELIEAQKIQLQLEATKDLYKKAYEEYAKDQQAYADAVKKTTEAERALAEAEANTTNEQRYSYDMHGNLVDSLDSYVRAVQDAKAEEKKLGDAAGSTQSSLNKLDEQQKLLTMSLLEGSDAITKAAANNSDFQAGVQSVDVDLVKFTSSLRDMGFTADDVARMTTEDAQKLAEGWKSGTDDLIKATEDIGIKVPDKLREMGKKAAEEAKKGGEATGQGQADGISSKKEDVRTAAQINADVALEGFRNADTGAVGSALTVDYSKGISKDKRKADTESKKVSDEAKKGFKRYSEEDVKGWGKHYTSNFSSGISGAIELAKGAANSVMSAVASIMHFSVPKAGIFSGSEKGGETSGKHLIQNFITGMLSQRQEIKAAAKDIAIDINDALMSELMTIDPMAQLTESMKRGTAALNMSAMMVGAAPSYNTNTQNLNFYGDYQSPDVIAREMRMQQHYGLAGRY